MKYSMAFVSLAAAVAPPAAFSLSSPTLSSRKLAAGDFDLLNDIFENASIILPEDYEVSERVGIATLNANIRNIKCYDLFVGDIAVDHEKVSSTAFQVGIALYGLDLTCEMDYDYKYGVLSGDGWVQIKTDGNTATSSIEFTSSDFDQEAPVESTVQQCLSDVEIERMDFEGDLASEIVEIFQGLIRNVVETAIGDVACDELSQIGTTLVGNMVDLADLNLAPYVDDLAESYTDPLYPERNLDLPTDLVPLNLHDTEGPVGRVFNEILHFVDTSLGSIVSEPGDATSTGSDLAINVMLRSLFLDEDRALTVDVSKLSLTSPFLFEGHDHITQFSIALNQVRIFGLDTFTRFNSFRNIGQHTIQNELTWDSLKIEFDVTVDIKPSTLDDAILQDPTSPGISERIAIGFTVDQVNAEASFLLVLDEEAIGSMELGPLFYTKHLLPCLLSVIHQVKVAGLDVDPKYVNEPYLSGFLSSGLDRFLTEAAGAAFAMYEGVLRNAIPNIFQSSVRDLINTSFLDVTASNGTDGNCPEVEPKNAGYIDFRDFFDPEKMTYGDVPPLLKEALDTELLALNPSTGQPRINEILVAPFTKVQSGKEGAMKFPMDLVSLSMSDAVSPLGLDSLGFRIFDPTIENLDTMGAPITLLEPNTTSAYILDNNARLGTNPSKLRVGLKAFFATEGDKSLAMSNELDIFVELADAEVWASLMTKLDATALFNFPLQDVTNIQCWLSTLESPELIKGDPNTGFSIQSLLLSRGSMNFNVSCADCSSPSLLVLPEVIASFDTEGVTDVLDECLVKLGLDLIQGDYTQSYINAILMESRKHCPHSPKYAGPDASTNIPALNAPSLSYESLETIAFASSLLLEVAAVVTAEAHSSYNPNSTTPLSGQNDLSIADNVELIDFMSLETSLGTWARNGIDGVIDYLKEVVVDPMGPGGSDMRVNSLIRSSLSERGYLSVPFRDLSIEGAGMQVSLKEINIIGLDTIMELDIFNPLASQTLKNQVGWKEFKAEIVLSLMASPNEHRQKAKQDIRINVQLSDVTLSLSTLLAVNKEQLGSLELISMLEIRNILPCLLTSAKAASVTEFNLSVGSISKFSIDGFQSREIQNAATRSTEILMQTYGDKIIDSIPKIFDSTVRTLINNWMQHYMDVENVAECNTFSAQRGSTSGVVDLRDLLWSVPKAMQLGGSGLSQYGDLFRAVADFTRIFFKTDESTGLSGLNEALVSPLTLELSNEIGTVHHTGDLFNGGTKVNVGKLNADVRFRAYDAKIENLDTIGDPLELLGGMMGEAYKLNNTMTFGVNQEPVRFSSKLFLSLDGDDDIQIKNEVDLSLEVTDANVILSTMANIAESRFFGFPLRDILNVNCWLAMIPAPSLDSRGVRRRDSPATAALDSLKAQVGQLFMTAECTNCTSPRMSELTDLLSDPTTRAETTEVANALLDYVTQLMGGNLVQVQIDRLLNEAALKCPHSPEYDPNATPTEYEAFEAPDTSYATSYLILLGGLTVAGIIIGSAVIFAVRFIVRRRHKKWVGQLPPYQVMRLASQQAEEARQEEVLNNSTSSMFRSKDIPFVVRWTIPIVILINVGLFLSGHLSLGATVNIEAQVAGETFTIDKFFEFSIARSTIDIWNAGGSALAILILIFSGIWPYTKLLMTLTVWFLSPSQMSVSRRGSVLLWLDWLAKWSMIDIFVLVISIAAFRVSIESPDTSYLPEDFYSVEMMVIPLWGLYANMIAQLVSQISSHVIIHYHRHMIAGARKQEGSQPQGSQESSAGIEVFRADMEKGSDVVSTSIQEFPIAESGQVVSDNITEKEALSQHGFSRPHRGETEKLVPRRYVNKLLPTCAICLIILVIIGCTLPSFSLELFGLVGVAVEFGQDFQDATQYHSVFSVVRLLFQQASYLGTAKDYIGLGTLSILFLCTLLLVPIVQTALLLKQWLAKTTPLYKQRLAVKLEILQAWQYLEVYLVALFVASWQLGPVSDSMINSYCENLEDMFARMVYYGVLKEEDAQCFSVTSHIENGAFFLAAGTLLLAFLSSFVFKAVVQYLRDEREQRQLVKDLERSTTAVEDSSHASDEAGDNDGMGFSGTIHPIPVLFTDSFRWMLKPDNSLPSSSRALFAGEPDNSHWSLPEATAVVDESPSDHMIKGTYVHDLDETQSKAAKGSPHRGSSMGSMSDDSYVTKRSSLGPGRKLSFNDDDDRKMPARPSKTDQRSISSQMESASSSFKDEASEAESLAYSLPSSAAQSFLVPPPPPPELKRASSKASQASGSRKAPPPSAYRLAALQSSSAASKASPFASYFDQRDEEHVSTKSNLKPPPPSSLKKAPQPRFEESSYTDDDQEEFTHISMEGSEVTGNDYYFEEDGGRSQQSRPRLI